MALPSTLNEQIFDRVKALPEKDKQAVLDFVEFLRIREDRAFIEYVNMRTEVAQQAKQRGEHFTSLDELQQEYA